MKKLFIAMAAVSALAIGAPAAAQYAGGSVQARLQQLQVRLDAGVRSGAISRGEAIRLREQLRQLTRLDWQYRRGGYSRAEIAALDQRIQAVRRQLLGAEGYAGNRYDRNRDGFDDRYDRNRDGDDDRFDRDDDGDDDRFDRDDDDRDDRFDRNRDGDDDRFDRDDDEVDDRYQGYGRSPLLRVGERAAVDLGAVPNEYQARYRDGAGRYYRSDGRAIYEIDARTNLVIRVHPLDL